ncbi:sporulation protein YlmC with PRC-barrel domain [Lewinella marina]|uniref:Photosystem reaction center subunit H n=1 Tax=Neolewinella marina TaxID=438751 RepID=A0A2G0CJD2_9BACT|nr:PRC-barrel domain-containing protein [Neolewinella marina]NJB84811.1 sporulation protein YlmC with PRC-barrel domain [Neolewinella marina]PHL00031.1 photosystem reaction center subunit H [Neolewinella marina]
MRNLILSSTSITGTNVINANGDNLGEIKDLMIDTENGTVNYAVLSFGGFLGMGDKYFAVPFEAFTINTVTEKFVLDVPKDRLENAPGFDKHNWPKSTDHQYWDSLHKHYGVERRSYAHDTQLA